VTDVLARGFLYFILFYLFLFICLFLGIDVDNVAVVNYDTPFRCEAYVHRVGRAARAGKQGEA
jgi:superfamily II DNA/RNA helicase